MVSPLSSTTMRTVPCIAGCAGPIFSSIGSAPSSNSAVSKSRSRGSIYCDLVMPIKVRRRRSLLEQAIDYAFDDQRTCLPSARMAAIFRHCPHHETALTAECAAPGNLFEVGVRQIQDKEEFVASLD